MKKKSNETQNAPADHNDHTTSMHRRSFIKGTVTTAIGITIVPRFVLGGPNHVAPSDKINVAYIGSGTQGLREMADLLQLPDVQITAVCDPQKRAINYYDWDPASLRNTIRKLTGNPSWETGGNNTIPGGLDNGVQFVNGYYSNQRNEKYNGCKAYSDFRELLAKEKVDAVKIITPDHLHGVFAMAALKRGIPVTMHKPLSNRLIEGKKVIDFAKEANVVTHLIPWDTNGNMDQIMTWINDGSIGTLKEVHNWSFRPVWPQYESIPTKFPKIPKGFDWDLWLGPEAMRRYHPHYTNMVFRGWYDFGGGSMADMGHYSLWTVFKALGLENPYLIEPSESHVCGIKNNLTAFQVRNDFSFPLASSVRFKYPASSKCPAIDLFWYDGGMRPPTPKEFYDNNIAFPSEGMMFVGDKGIIMSSEFLVREPYLLSSGVKQAKDVSPSQGAVKIPGIRRFIDGVKSGRQIEGNFREAWPIAEAVNLYAAALRSGKTLKYDAQALKITNVEEANKYLNRDYRPGWELDKI
jgi:hypothetical protein